MTEGERLKEIRKVLGLTQRELSEALEIKQGSYSDVERGKAGISSLLLKNLIKKFRVNPIWLCEGEGRMFISMNDSSIVNPSELGDLFSTDLKEPSAGAKKHSVLDLEAQIERLERQQQYIESLTSLIQSLREEH